MSTTISQSPPSALRTAWFVVALLWPVALLNYLDRQMIATMKFSVMEEIPSIGSDDHWGYMLGQFKWVYAFCSPLGGYLADRFSRRYIICASLFIWSAITWATGQVETYDGLLWTRTLMGISEACYIPAALALIAEYHWGATRSRAVGLHQTAIYAGIILGGFGGHVADAPDWGWRGAFDYTGLAGVIYAVPLLFLLRDAPSAPDQVEEKATRPPLLTALGELLSNRSFLLLVACFTLPALAGWIVKDWMPSILKGKFDIGQGQAGVSATLYVNIASLGAVFGGGWLADALMRRTPRGRIYVSALGMTLLIPSLFGVGNSSTLPVAIGFLVVFGIGWGCFDCNNMPILSQITRPQLRATGYGVMNLVSMIGGGFADWGFGVLRTRDVPLNLIFGIFASAALVSILLVLLIRVDQQQTR
ncbi:MAG: MFS transporter [Planctomycetes bacterium]|nr:MFS transporter [Planctomycetota bacterium]